jgi:hypothetical protein
MGHGTYSYASGAGAYAGAFISANYRGLYADGKGTYNNGYYDGYFPHWIRVGGSVVHSGGWSVLAVNTGTEALEPGDLVAFVGMDGDTLDAGGVGLMVEKAGASGGAMVVGVAEGAYIMDQPAAIEAVAPDAEEEMFIEEPVKDQTPLAEPEKAGELLEGDEPPAVEAVPDAAKIDQPMIEEAPAVPTEAKSFAEADMGYAMEASVQPGGYVLIAIQGFAQVNVDARASVEAGDWLIAAADGGVDAISERQLAWAQRRGDVVIGRALAAAVDGKVWVYVNFQ